MPLLNILILQYADDRFPGWVECALVDAFSARHLFHEKVPVVTALSLDAKSKYPQPGFMACEVEASWLDEAGRILVRVNTERPWGVQSTVGVTRFVVFQTQLGSPVS